MWSKLSGQCGTNPTNPIKPFNGSKGTERVTIGDYSFCECRANPAEGFDLVNGSDVQINDCGGSRRVGGSTFRPAASFAAVFAGRLHGNRGIDCGYLTTESAN